MFRDVPARGPGYDGWVWLEGTRRSAERAIAVAREGSPLALGGLGDHALLPLLVASLRRDAVSVLDFGGGMGIGWAAVRATVPDIALRYWIVETEGTLDVGRTLFRPEDGVTFSSELPDSWRGDIVYSRSALMYVEDHSSVLRRLFAYGAPYVLLVETMAGAFPTYASAQLNLPGSVLAHWFFDLDELVSAARSAGYRLALRLPSSRAMRGQRVPPSHRLERASSLLFTHA
jgi:putative methyltransferase (TIGR04325 family)